MKHLLVVWLVLTPLSAASLIATQPPAQEEFVPIEQLPGQEEMPAAPLVAAAYGVAWAAVLFYVWTVWRRLARVERELAEVRLRIQADKGGPPR